jgi:geranylgeranyl reductase family protein
MEKGIPPRHKTCGGGLLGRVLPLLPPGVDTVVESECLRASLHHHDPDLSFETTRDSPVVTMVMRDRFDHLLNRAAQDAGAEMVTGITVRDVKQLSDRVALETDRSTFTATHVVAADGAGSMVAKCCGLPPLRRVIPALECEATVDPATIEKFSGTARFDFGLVPHGYAWVFPKRSHLSIGVLTTRRGSCNLHEAYARYLARLGIAKIIHEERHGYMIPLQPRDRMFEAPRILFAGDAAGLVDPITAEGISAAVISGQLAAQAIVEGCGDDMKTRRTYRNLLHKNLLPELRVARVLARLFYDFPRARIWLLRHHGRRLTDSLARIVMGECGYRDPIRRPANYLRLLFPS